MAKGLGVSKAFSGPIAARLAIYSQAADMFERFDAISLALDKVGKVAAQPYSPFRLTWTAGDQNYIETIYDGLHAIPATRAEATTGWLNNARAKTEQYIVERMGAGDMVRAGIALHRYGDLFAHVDSSGKPYYGITGHLRDGHDPDTMFTKLGNFTNVGKVVDYEVNLARVLSRGLIAGGYAQRGATVGQGVSAGLEYFTRFYTNPGNRSEASFIGAILRDPAHRRLGLPSAETIRGTARGGDKEPVMLDVARRLSGRR